MARKDHGGIQQAAAVALSVANVQRLKTQELQGVGMKDLRELCKQQGISAGRRKDEACFLLVQSLCDLACAGVPVVMRVW